MVLLLVIRHFAALIELLIVYLDVGVFEQLAFWWTGIYFAIVSLVIERQITPSSIENES